MHNKKIIAKGIIIAIALAYMPVDSLATIVEEYNLINTRDNIKESEKEGEYKYEPKETIKVNKNIVQGSVLEIELADGEFVPDLNNNPDGYETIKVTTTGNKKLVSTDYTNLKNSGIPKIDLSNAYSDNIPSRAFSYATHLTDFKFPKGITNIENGAFCNCNKLTGDLIIPDSVVSIGQEAFYNCNRFTGNLIISDSVVSIGAQAFFSCSGFTGNLIIPNSVTSIGDDAFAYVYGIDKILIKVDSSDLNTNYKKRIIDKLPDKVRIVIDIPYDFDITGTWMETTSKTIAKPIIKNVVDGIESDLVNFKGDAVSLYIPSLYQESNVTVLKNNKPFTLPAKDANNKHLFTESGIYQVTVITDLGNTSIINFEVKDKQFEIAEEAVEKAEADTTIDNIESARDLINNLPESTIKDQLQDRLDNLYPNISLESKTATANLDIYIKSENMLSLSLDTNNVTFTDFSGVEDMEKLNAINLTVNSSLPYKINAYLVTEIQNADKSKTMDKDILNIKANGESNYSTFVDTSTPIVLLDDQPVGNNISHGIDLMLNGSIAHEKDVYKTTIKFEAEQK